MFKGLGAFLTIDSTFLLKGGGVTDVFVMEGEAASTENRREEVFIFMSKVKVDS